MKVLVTGSHGFIGSHVARIFAERGHTVLTFGKDVDLAKEVPLTEPVDVVFNLASHSHVDHSIVSPVRFIQNNVNVALNMLEYARAFPPRRFIQFSTDEVYGPAPYEYQHVEWDAIIPSNPYAASKASQDAIAISYWRTYGVPLVLTQTMNVYGPGQLDSKFVPMAARAIREGRPVPVHCELKNHHWIPGSRHWLYVEDVPDALEHIAGLDLNVYPTHDRPSRWNVVGEQEVSNVQMVWNLAHVMGLKARVEHIDFHSSRPGHDRRYALDGSKLAEAGWTPKTGLMQGLAKTVEVVSLAGETTS